MTKLADHHSNTLVKVLCIGDAKSGKTGSLTSLVKAGYKLRILDMDNLLDILKYLVQRECPNLIGNVEYRTLRDKRRATSQGMVIDGSPTAFIDAVKMLAHWTYRDIDGSEIDLECPADWGPDCILVIDSLSRLCDASYDWCEMRAPRGRSGDYDGRAVYGDAQDAVESMLAGLTSRTFKTNVIVIAHIQYMDLPEGGKKGFPQGVGQKLSPKIPQYFPTVLHYSNKAGKRIIKTTSTPLIDLANPAPHLIDAEYPMESGLASIFRILQSTPIEEEPTPAQPKIITPIKTIRRA